MGEQAGTGAVRSRYRTLRLAALPLVVAATLAACGPAGTSPGTGGSGPAGGTDGIGRAAPPTGNPTAALAKWQAFPATADPRPLILTRGTVIDPANGFRTDEDKLAYLAGEFELATKTPAAPARSAGYAIVGVKAALDRLRATGSSQPAARPLRIVKASLAQASFGTDRGPRSLPAWRFELDGVTDPVFVLAVDNKHLWRSAAPIPGGVDQQAILRGDGRSVSFSFYGSPPGPPPCGADYTAEVVESRTAVVVTPRQISAQGGPSEAACPAIAARRSVTVQLAAPLGARVLLTPDGSPIPVTR